MTKEYIVIAFTENQIGVLNRITALYLRRKINIESLKVSESSIRGISMFVISAFTTRETIDKLVKQLRNIIDVIQVEYYSNEELITQEIALYKITSKIFRESGTVDRIVREWNARIIEMNPQYVVVEKTGRHRRDALRVGATAAAHRVHPLGNRRAAPRLGRRQAAGQSVTETTTKHEYRI